MADIQFTQTNNFCFNNALGNIFINQINFTEDFEEISFASFDIQWSGDFSSISQISADGRVAEFLSNGSYSFTINSSIDSSVLGPYNIVITSPPELLITSIKYNKYSCSFDDNSVRVYISGGTPPYVVSVGGASIETSDTEVLLSNITSGISDVVVSDSNGCSHTFDTQATILDASIEVTILEVLAPLLYDSYGTVRLQISGYGPFDMWFTNSFNNETIYINAFSTEYITSINNNIYEYNIFDKLTPGEYLVTIKSSVSCSSELSVSIPNIIPMSVSLSIFDDESEKVVDKKLSLPIFDTILIPYKNIQENTNLWQLIKSYNLKDSIVINLDGRQKKYKIVRYSLDKYCLEENKIEILKLGKSSNKWFYFLYIAPSINLSADFQLVNSKYEIVNSASNELYPLTLGLTKDGEIDTENPSLIKGSFLLQDIDHNQFVNTETYINFTDRRNNAYVSFDDTTSIEHDFFLKDISKKVLKNIYLAGYVTSINFLEQFNKSNSYVNINDTACVVSNEEYQYILQAKNLIKSINNLNNINSTYIYNLDNVSKLGQIILSIDAQLSFSLSGGVEQTNSYDVEYYYFDEDSIGLSAFYQNNQPVKTLYLKNIGSGYVIIRIRDTQNNRPKVIRTNETTTTYDKHFTAAKNIIQKYNSHITSSFIYGDILCYVGIKGDASPPIPDPSVPQPSPPVPTIPVIPPEPNIEQTHDDSNTSSLFVTLYSNITCFLYGPKNYKHSFKENITFTNMIPGVYRIVGSDKELFDNNLYPQEFRIVIDKNTTNNIDINFVSYKDKVFLKD